MSAAPRPPVPTAFFGHGSPLNTLADNRFTRAWQRYGAALRPPRAILVISAHWYVPGTRVTAARRPPTIRDFNANFPPHLFAFEYPAAGDPDLARRVAQLAGAGATLDDTSWGIDHGAFSVLAHVFADAAIPVVELSIDRSKPPEFHYDLAARLSPLRDEGVFIMSSGNVVHNLELAERAMGATPFDWAARFEQCVLALAGARDHAALVAYQRLGSDARLAVPTPDHYLPLLYTLALQRDGERVSTIVDGFDFGSGSMLSLSVA